MHVGVCRVQLRLPENGSLKDKRQVVRSLTGRIKSRYNVAIAEVDRLDSRQWATLGIATVNTDARHANETLSKVVEYIQTSRPDAELVDYELEFISI